MDTPQTNAWQLNDVCNATFGSMFDAPNYGRQGEILYIGYRSAVHEQDSTSGGNPFAKSLRLVALDMNTKQVVWQESFTFAVTGMSVYTTAMTELRVDNDTVYLFTNLFNGGGGSWLTALDAATGRHRWSRTGVLATAEGHMVVCQGRVFLRESRQMQVLDGATGETVWRYPYVGMDLGRSVSVVHDTVFIIEAPYRSRSPQPEREERVRALRLVDGAELWARSLGPAGALAAHSTHIATHDAVYVVNKRSGRSGSDVVNAIYALDAHDGAIRWMSPPGRYPSPVLADDQLLYMYGNDAGAVLDVATGAPLWARQVDGCTEAIALPDHGFYGSTGGTYLAAFRGTDGQQLWFSTRAMSLSAGNHVTIDDTHLYFVDGDHTHIYRVDRTTGAEELFLQIEPRERSASQREWFQVLTVR